jgi:hypothetical protein
LSTNLAEPFKENYGSKRGFADDDKLMCLVLCLQDGSTATISGTDALHSN